MRDDGTAADAKRTYEVAARIVTAGDFVQVGSPLVRLVDADPLKLRVPVTERHSRASRVNRFAVKVEAFAEGRARGSSCEPAVDTSTRTFA